MLIVLIGQNMFMKKIVETDGRITGAYQTPQGHFGVNDHTGSMRPDEG